MRRKPGPNRLRPYNGTTVRNHDLRSRRSSVQTIAGQVFRVGPKFLASDFGTVGVNAPLRASRHRGPTRKVASARAGRS